MQTYSGQGPLDLGVGPIVLVLIGLVLLAASALIALRGVGARLQRGRLVAK